MFLVSNYPYIPISPTTPTADKVTKRADKKPAIRKTPASDKSKAEDALNANEEHPDWLTLSDEEKLHQKVAHKNSDKNKHEHPPAEPQIKQMQAQKYKVGQQVKVMNLLALSRPVILQEAVLRQADKQLPFTVGEQTVLPIADITTEKDKQSQINKNAPERLRKRFNVSQEEPTEKPFEVTC